MIWLSYVTVRATSHPPSDPIVPFPALIILSIGWKYQKTVCLPQGMGVTFFGIGPIGATILMVELLKLPLILSHADISNEYAYQGL